MDYPIRINTYLRDMNLASRREADKLIKAGLVFVNDKRGKVGMLIQEGDKVTVKKTKEKKNLYLAYFKPRGFATQALKNEESVITEWKEKGLFPIGRLDKESEGLLILTNDGRITERMLHPRFVHEKEYTVSVREKIPSFAKKVLEKGILDNREKLTAKKVLVTGPHELKIILTEGKKHQIRRMLSNLNLTVEKLVRTRIMGILLKPLRSGSSRELDQDERKNLFLELGIPEKQDNTV